MALLKRSRPKEAIVAAAGVPGRKSMSRRGSQPYRWQQEIALYVRYGPGLVGNYVDFVSDKIFQAGVRMEVRQADGSWQPLPTGTQFEATCRGVWAVFRNDRQTPEQLLARYSRLNVSSGEAYLITLPSLQTGNQERHIAHINELSGWEFPSVDRAGSVIWHNPWDGIKRRIPWPSPNLVRLWNPVDDDPSIPTSELQRALPHIREFIDLRRRNANDARSRMTANDILAFGKGSEIYEATAEDDPYNGLPKAIVDYLEMADVEFSTPYWERPPVAETVPFPMLGEKPEKVEVGRDLDGSQVSNEEHVIGLIAQSLRVPKLLLTEGPGTAKFENEGYLGNAAIDDCVGPIGYRICSDIWIAFFRPVLEQVLKVRGHLDGQVSMSQLRLAPNLDLIRPKPDQTQTVLEAWDKGLASRRSAETVLGFEILDIPDDVTDYEFWQQYKKVGNGGGAAPQASSTDDAQQGGTVTAAAGSPDFSDSIMVALLPAPGEADWSRVTPAHLTLVYSGKVGPDAPDASTMLRAVEDVANSTPVFTATRSGVAQLGNEGANVMLVEHEQLQKMRHRVEMFCRSNHPGFIPHVTINYGGRVPELPETVRFDRIGLFYGSSVFVLPLQDPVAVVAGATERPLRALPLGVDALPAILAAVDEEKALESLSSLDLATHSSLQRLASVLYDQAVSEVARQATRSVPGRDELREELKDQPDHAKYAILLAAGRAPDIQFEEIPAVDRFQQEAQDILSDYVSSYTNRTDIEVDESYAAEAAAGLALLFIEILNGRMTRGSSSNYFPDGYLTRAMSKALDVESTDEQPVTAPASTGYARKLELDGTARIQYEWVHGFYGAPKTPFEPHLERDGNKYSVEAATSLEYPAGGHRGCRCAMVPRRV